MRQLARDLLETPVNHAHTPAADTAAVVTLAAVADEMHHIDGIICGYDETPAAARITISDGVQDDLTVPIVVADIVSIGFGGHPVFIGGAGLAVVVTLAAGGGTASGELNVSVR